MQQQRIGAAAVRARSFRRLLVGLAASTVMTVGPTHAAPEPDDDGRVARVDVDSDATSSGVEPVHVDAEGAGVHVELTLPADAPATADLDLDWVTVGAPGNRPDTRVMNDGTTGHGSVDRPYRIGKFQITNAQYVEFLNAKARLDPYLLYFALMDRNPVPQGSGIVQRGAPGSYTYEVEPGREDKPVNYVSVYDAMRMANWMHNGQGDGDTETGAYTLVGGTPIPLNGAEVERNPGAKYFLPTEDEWYKAAYYDAGRRAYWRSPARSDEPIVCAPPGSQPNTANCESMAGDEQFAVGGAFTEVGAYTASAGPWGTYDQGGNVFEYTETLTGVPPTCLTMCLPPLPTNGPFRILRGTSCYDAGSWAQADGRGSITAETEFAAQGFRLAAAA